MAFRVLGITVVGIWALDDVAWFSFFSWIGEA